MQLNLIRNRFWTIQTYLHKKMLKNILFDEPVAYNCTEHIHVHYPNVSIYVRGLEFNGRVHFASGLQF